MKKSLRTTADLRSLQRLMGKAIMRPLTPKERMQPRWINGKKTTDIASSFIKPNDRLSSFDRLEVYNRQYWFRLLDCFAQDFPGLRAVVGHKKFFILAEAYLTRYPSKSFSLRNLGGKVEKFLLEEPKLTAPHHAMALDMARFEWAQVLAFDEAMHPVLTAEDVMGTNPQKLKLNIQPYVTFLKLGYPLDDFILEVKKRDSLRSEASNAVEEPRQKKTKTVKLPKAEKIFLAVHRLENSLYYKRLDREAFLILIELQKGRSLAAACDKALGKRAVTEPGWADKIRKWFANWMALGWFYKN